MTTEHFTFNIPTTIYDDVRAWTDEAIADCINEENKCIAVAEQVRGRLTMELTRRLQARNAMELAHPTLDVKLVYPSPTYDMGCLVALAEVVPPEDYAKAYQESYVKQVPQPARFDGRVLNTLARKYGEPVTAILDRAKLPSSPRLVVEEKATP